MSNDGLGELLLALDERNLAHVLCAVGFVGLASRISDALPEESTCWWSERGFVLKTALRRVSLFGAADRFLRSLRWIPGIGSAEQGIFVAYTELGSNPFISLADDGQENSPFKTFSGQIDPGKLLNEQQGNLRTPTDEEPWLLQTSRGVASWGFDSRVGSHAYDLGFSSNDEGSGKLDPIYPAVELLSIAASSFFAPVQGWQLDENAVVYSLWTRPISLSLVPCAVAARLDGLAARRYRVTNRGAAYGKGAAYRFFPESALRI
jgi:hypothetical protein